MAYTPYSQALPDTSRYTLDPVLQERLYQPVRTDPYQGGLLSSWADDYYADPLGYTNKRFGKLDETLETDAPEVGLGGMFAPPPQNTGGGDSPMGRNAIQEREDSLRAANLPEEEVQAIMAAEQEARGKSINDFLTNLSKGGLFGIASQLIGGGLNKTAVPTSVATAQTSAQIAQQQREKEQRVIADFARKMEAEKQAEALAAARAAQEAMNASAMYQDSNYQPYSDSGGGYTGMSDSNSNAGTSGSPSYGSGGWL